MSMCRQIVNTQGQINEAFVGIKGRASCDPFVITTGAKVWKTKPPYRFLAHQQEHVNLIESIRKGKPPNELRAGTESNLTSTMGRMAVNTGKGVTWGRPSSRRRALAPKIVSFSDKIAVPPWRSWGPTRWI